MLEPTFRDPVKDWAADSMLNRAQRALRQEKTVLYDMVIALAGPILYHYYH